MSVREIYIYGELEQENSVMCEGVKIFGVLGVSI
jgi:hypothetical protein